MFVESCGNIDLVSQGVFFYQAMLLSGVTEPLGNIMCVVGSNIFNHNVVF